MLYRENQAVKRVLRQVWLPAIDSHYSAIGDESVLRMQLRECDIPQHAAVVCSMQLTRQHTTTPRRLLLLKQRVMGHHEMQQVTARPKRAKKSSAEPRLRTGGRAGLNKCRSGATTATSADDAGNAEQRQGARSGNGGVVDSDRAVDVGQADPGRRPVHAFHPENAAGQ